MTWRAIKTQTTGPCPPPPKFAFLTCSQRILKYWFGDDTLRALLSKVVELVIGAMRTEETQSFEVSGVTVTEVSFWVGSGSIQC